MAKKSKDLKWGGKSNMTKLKSVKPLV